MYSRPCHHHSSLHRHSSRPCSFPLCCLDLGHGPSPSLDLLGNPGLGLDLSLWRRTEKGFTFHVKPVAAEAQPTCTCRALAHLGLGCLWTFGTGSAPWSSHRNHHLPWAPRFLHTGFKKEKDRSVMQETTLTLTLSGLTAGGQSQALFLQPSHFRLPSHWAEPNTGFLGARNSRISRNGSQHGRQGQNGMCSAHSCACLKR